MQRVQAVSGWKGLDTGNCQQGRKRGRLVSGLLSGRIADLTRLRPVKFLFNGRSLFILRDGPGARKTTTSSNNLLQELNHIVHPLRLIYPMPTLVVALPPHFHAQALQMLT